MCLNQTYSRVCVGRYLCDRFPSQSGVKQGGSLSLLLFNLAVEYVIRRLQANQDGLNLSDAHQLLVYADVNILSESIHTMKKNTITLFVAGKRISEVNAQRAKYMVTSQEHAGQNYDFKIGNKFFGKVEQFIYWGTTLTKQNSVQDEIMSKLKKGND